MHTRNLTQLTTHECNGKQLCVTSFAETPENTCDINKPLWHASHVTRNVTENFLRFVRDISVIWRSLQCAFMRLAYNAYCLCSRSIRCNAHSAWGSARRGAVYLVYNFSATLVGMIIVGRGPFRVLGRIFQLMRWNAVLKMRNDFEKQFFSSTQPLCWMLGLVCKKSKWLSNQRSEKLARVECVAYPGFLIFIRSDRCTPASQSRTAVLKLLSKRNGVLGRLPTNSIERVWIWQEVALFQVGMKWKFIGE